MSPVPCPKCRAYTTGMNHADTLRQLLDARPFKPFTVQLTRGARHKITDPDHVLLTHDSLVLNRPEKKKTLTCPFVRIIKITPD